MDAKGQMSGRLSGQHGSRQGLSWEVAGSTGVPVLGRVEAHVIQLDCSGGASSAHNYGSPGMSEPSRVRLGTLLGQREVETGVI